MADEVLKRDGNNVPVLGGVTDNVAQEVRMLRVDPDTNRLLASAPASSGIVAPSSTPSRVGLFYVDTVAKKLYFSSGTSSSADWTIAN